MGNSLLRFLFGCNKTRKTKNPVIALTAVILVLSISVLVGNQCRNSIKKASEGSLSNDKQEPLKTRSELQFEKLFMVIRRIPLASPDGFHLGPMPSIGAINRRGEFIILDNYGVRQIVVFDDNGNPKARIGSQGNGRGQYLFPDNLFFQRDLDRLFVYDGDLLKVLEFDEKNNYVADLDLPIYLEQLLVTGEERYFCYTSGTAGSQGIDRVVYEFDKEGSLQNKFLKMPKAYSPAAESKGGGILLFNDSFYVITPYEYTISKFSISGKMLEQASFQSPFYTPIKMYANSNVETDFTERKRYHSTWSHILQIIQIGENQLGVVFNEAGTSRDYLDIFDISLRKIAGSILLPDHLAGPHALYTLGDRLYMVEPLSNEGSGRSGDICIAEYVLNHEEIEK